MEILVDGKTYNAAPVCQAKDCPHKSCARVYDLTESRPKWKDLCYGHAAAVKRVYKDQVEIKATWNGYDIEEFEDE